MSKHLHIVTHDIPWPADYGGVVDLFYKIRTLHQMGISIHLHCFTQGRMPREELDKYCTTVTYYKREKNIRRFSLKIPFIVNTRKNSALIADLKKDNYPVLLEGIHCSYYLAAGQLDDRKVILRLHNAEFEYYKQLAKNEQHLFKKIYFLLESRLLKKYEAALANKTTIIAVSEQDVNLYKELFGAKDIQHLPVFIPYTLALGKEGKGCFCLYHGNLSINENETAALWLLENVFNKTGLPLVIAGKDPSKKLEHAAHLQKNTCLVANPSDKEMQDLIAKAQINILPSFNNTGVKLKLINALFNGRFCLVNPKGAEGSGLETACCIANSADEFIKSVEELYQLNFKEEEIEKRNGLLQRLYNNEANANKLIRLIWN